MAISVSTFISVCVCAVAIAVIMTQHYYHGGSSINNNTNTNSSADTETLESALYGLRYAFPAKPPSEDRSESAAGCQAILDHSGGHVMGLQGQGFYLSLIGSPDGWDKDSSSNEDDEEDIVDDDIDEDEIADFLRHRKSGVHVERVTCDMSTEGGGWTLLSPVRQFSTVQSRDEYPLTSAHYATFRPRRCIADLQQEGKGRGGEVLLRDAGRGTFLRYEGGDSDVSVGIDLLKIALQFDGKWYIVHDPQLDSSDPREKGILDAAHGTLELVEGRAASRESRAGTVRVLEHSNGRCTMGGSDFPRTCARSVIVRPPEGTCRLTGVSDIGSVLSGKTEDELAARGHDVRLNMDIYVR